MYYFLKILLDDNGFEYQLHFGANYYDSRYLWNITESGARKWMAEPHRQENKIVANNLHCSIFKFNKCQP